MQKFTIRDIEQLCNIKAHTFRIWEQRHDLFRAKRKESKHRFYDNDDLKKLLRISFLYHNGWKISKIASLSEEEIINEVRKTEINPENYRNFIVQLLEAAIDFDEKAFLEIFDHLIQKIGLEKCITQVCYPYLHRVGLLWTSNNVIPAQEHFSSYIIQHKIIAETEKLPLQSQNNNDRILLFTPKGEHHELPLLFINYLLKENGWQTIYLGSSVKFEYISEVIKEKSTNYIYLHLITNLTGFEVDDYLEKLCTSFLHLKVVASGASIQKAQRSFVNFVPLKNDDAIYNFIKRKTNPLEVRNS